MPVLGVIEPGARAAVRISPHGPVGVIGTAGPVASGAYPRTLHALASGVRVVQQACPLFVPLVEEGWFDHPATDLVAREYLAPLLAEGIEALVLGGTHYPLLAPVLSGVAGKYSDIDIHLFADSAKEVELYLLNAGIRYRASQAKLHVNRVEKLLPSFSFDSEETEIRLTVLDRGDERQTLRAAGITAYLGVQTLLIVGGNLRLLPLTGVTLPFLSYGGASLLTSFVTLLFLMLSSHHMDEEPAPLPNPRPYLALGMFLLLGLFVAALATGWWSVVRGPSLLTRTDNPRRIIEDRYVPRGQILDRNNQPITLTTGEAGSYIREYRYPDLAPVTGYNHPIYGQSGLEASMDDYLRGVKGNPAAMVWWSHLLYGMSPHGLDVRLSIDLDLQRRADEMMTGHSGAALLINAQSGEILAMSSLPTFNPNYLNEIGSQLNKDPAKPLINRAVQGVYPAGSVLEPFARALYGDRQLSEAETQDVYNAFGLNTAPLLQFETAQGGVFSDGDIHISPVQAVLAAAALSNHGVAPAPRIAVAVDTPREGWVVLRALGEALKAVQPTQADEAAAAFIGEGKNYWSHIGRVTGEEGPVTWFIAGTPPNWQATPVAVVVLLEHDNERLAQWIGQELLMGAMNP